MAETGFYIEFKIASEKQFENMCGVVDALREAMRSDNWKDEDYWLSFFDEKSRSFFWWPTDSERDAWLKKWFSTPARKRYSDPSSKIPWEFDAMIDSFENAEYVIISCKRVSADTSRIVFSPYAHPFGGTDSLKALVESFGHKITSAKS